MQPMTKIFTPDDVVRFVYEETDPDEGVEIATALANDAHLYGFYREALALRGQLDKVICTPPDRAVQAILAYAHRGRLQTIE